MVTKHLKHIDCEEFSPLLLAACITGMDYKDAFKILGGQGCEISKKPNFYYDDTPEIPTGLESKSDQDLLVETYRNIGEYLAKAGGDAAMKGVLNNLFLQVVELKNDIMQNHSSQR